MNVLFQEATLLLKGFLLCLLSCLPNDCGRLCRFWPKSLLHNPSCANNSAAPCFFRPSPSDNEAPSMASRKYLG